MCGIAGFWSSGVGAQDSISQVRTMCSALAHRGPDSDGFWTSNDTRMAFGHRRLSIVDLSEHGHQPMMSADGRYYITYNGELYNTQELRSELLKSGVHCRGTSDTEVLVNAISVFGIERVLEQVNGMFSFAVWDQRDRELTVVRDRVGIKPLFYSDSVNGFAFCSEVRALALVNGFDRTLDNAAIGCFLQYNSIRAPLTIYRGARALEAGSILRRSADGQVKIHKYWDVKDAVINGRESRASEISDTEAVDRLEALLEDSVRRQLVSDVPIGCFLSGGIDSSTVAALMQKVSHRPIETFSIGFNDKAIDEAKNAREVSKSLGTVHNELYVSEREVLDTFPRITSIYDQPFADLSSVPTFLLCDMAKKSVSVALSGDGGDEMFYGYSRYEDARKARRIMASLPTPVRSVAAGAINKFGGKNFRVNGFSYTGNAARKAWHFSRLLEFTKEDINDSYLHFSTHWSEPEQIAPGAIGGATQWNTDKTITRDFDELMMLYDTRTFMTEQVLAKVDRASMAVSLEARVPLLDHRIIELAWQLPQSFKYRDGITKWGLRQVLYRYVPSEIVNRPKSGFSAPIGEWMRGPLREWCESLFSSKKLEEGGVLNSVAVRRLWASHLKGDVDVSSLLWSLLMLQSWIEENR